MSGSKTSDMILVGRYDYLAISSNYTSNVYCGSKTGQTVHTAGDYAIITFHSDSDVQRDGFLLFFTSVPTGKCKKKKKRHMSMSGKCVSSIATIC